MVAGTMPGTFQDPYFYGGIWGVNEKTFEATKTPLLSVQVNDIQTQKQCFGIHLYSNMDTRTGPKHEINIFSNRETCCVF